MNLYLNIARVASSLIASIFITLFISIVKPIANGSLPINILLGLLISILFSATLIGLDMFSRKCNLKIFNTIILGLFIGIFLGKGLISIFETLLLTANISLDIPGILITLPKAFLYLIGIHLGIVLTLSYQEELHISIPFIRFSEVMRDKKDIVLDDTILSDPRILDFLSTGILNNRLILPSFVLKNLQDKVDNSEDHVKAGARKLLDVIAKLKTMKNLDLKENQTDFSDITDVRKKVLRLAKITKSNILVADGSKLEAEGGEVKYLNLTNIANSLKNVMSTGETIEIKVQRYGKEPKQGVGYLEDGTMVVINNGGNFIGETIETQVISVKQTSAGRIIFTNALSQDGDEDQEYAYQSGPVYEHQHD